MSIRKLRAGRVPGVTAQEYVGSHGTIFYDEVLGTLRISDGVTPGGQPLTLVSEDFNFTFGDFIATTEEGGSQGATLSSVNANQDINIVSNGTGVVNLVGELHLHTPAQWATSQDGAIAVMTVSSEGFLKIRTPTVTTTNAGLMIIGSADGSIQPAGGISTGRMVHITGNDGTSARMTMDAFGTNAFASYIGRAARGTAASPLPLQAGDVMLRLSSSGWAEAGYNTTSTGGPTTSIDFVATDNYTHTVYGSAIKFYTSPQGSIGRNLSLTVDTTGITATRFFGNVTGNVTGNVSGTAPAGSLTGTTLASNVVTSSLTSVGTLGSLTVTNTVSAGYLAGKLIRVVRAANTIADGGTLTIDFTNDEIVTCTWGNGMTIAYTGFQAGRVIKVMATKSSGTGTDSIDLGGLTASHVSSGNTSITAAADTTTFMEFICTGTTIGSVYVKL